MGCALLAFVLGMGVAFLLASSFAMTVSEMKVAAFVCSVMTIAFALGWQFLGEDDARDKL